MLVQASGGMMELDELLEADKGITKKVREKPGLWKIARKATVPASLVLGFSLVPSPKIAVHAAGALVTGIGGVIGRNKITDIGSDVAKPAIAECLIENGITEPLATAAKLEALKEDLAVHPDDFKSICTDIYRKYLVGMVRFDHKPQSAELTELQNLKDALSLDNLAVGEAHMLAAEDWYRSTFRGFSEEELDDEDSKERMSLNKFLYLTERALKQNDETEEAFLYEMTRTAKVFNMTYHDALSRVEEVVEPFYERALKSSRSKLGTNQVSITMLERARRTLGVDDRVGFNLHESALNDEVRSLLGYSEDGELDDPATVKYPEGALERLDQLRELLSLEQEDVEYEITSEGMPLFRATASDAMKDAVEGTISAEEAWGIMEKRREELLIPESRSDELVSSVVFNSLGGPMEEIQKYAEVNNEGAVYSSMMEALEAKNIVVQLLDRAGYSNNFYEDFCDPLRQESVNKNMSSQERFKIYDMFVKRSIKASDDGKLSEEQDAIIQDVKGIMAIDDFQAEGHATKAFGPKLNEVMERAMNEILEDYTPELVETLSTEINQIIDDYKISERMIAQNGRSLYSKALAHINANAPAGVPTKEQNESLKALQDLYNLHSSEVVPLHLTAFGPVYKKSVEEAMSITGVIRPEFRQPLEDLRERLGVSESQTRDIFMDAVEQRMIPMVEWIVSEMERTIFNQQQLSERRQKDLGEDYFQSGKKADGTLGIGAEVNALGDIMNLIDFYTENNIAEKTQIDTELVDEKEVPVYETLYPITALATGAVDQQMAEVLYRQFVVGSFTTAGPNAERYENSRATWGGILGLSSEKMEEIGSNIADTVYDNYVGQNMRQKGALDQQDMMFLANLQKKLGLTEEQGERFLVQSQKKVLSEELEAIFMNSPKAENLQIFREKCEGLGLNLEQDVGVEKSRIIRMFELEIAPGLESGEITVENGDELTEISESLGFSEEDAEKALETLLLAQSDRLSTKIAKDIRRGRVDAIVEPVKTLIRYGAFLNGELGIEIEEKVGRQIFNAYENFDFEGLSESEVEENKEMLKTILSLS